jgi:hypothetical protein
MDSLDLRQELAVAVLNQPIGQSNGDFARMRLSTSLKMGAIDGFKP